MRTVWEPSKNFSCMLLRAALKDPGVEFNAGFCLSPSLHRQKSAHSQKVGDVGPCRIPACLLQQCVKGRRLQSCLPSSISLSQLLDNGQQPQVLLRELNLHCRSSLLPLSAVVSSHEGSQDDMREVGRGVYKRAWEVPGNMERLKREQLPKRCSQRLGGDGAESGWVHTKFSRRSLCNMVTPSSAVSAHKGSSPHTAAVGKGRRFV